MTRRTNIVPKEMEVIHQRFHYNPGVRAGNLLFVAGQVGRDQNLNVIEGKEAQFVQAFENLKKVLTAAGAGFDDVVEMVTYHTDMRDLQLFMKVKDRYFTREYPAWTGVGVTALAMPGLMVEIKCVAILKD
ncbi:MAG TPA: RidA family protein [Candidatus Binataceae bacterium]|nr:RidA family protein [Candidatus Binataceae bacterium]